MELTKIAFIVNPISGTKTKDKIIRLIPHVFNESNHKIEIFRTEYPGHGKQLARQLGKEYDIIVAVGGDGTVNEVASGLIDTKARMGIVPCGSGDGLARHLKIPQNPLSALLAIKNGVAHPMDVILFNNRVSVNLSGIGFDAVVAHNFAKSVRRGVLSYIRQVVLAYFYFKPFDVIVKANEQSYKRKAWLVAVANSSQFGNNAVISPLSEVSDGKMEICVLKPFPVFAIPAIVGLMFMRNIHRSRFIEIFQTDAALIELSKKIASHIDGEPFEYSDNYKITLLKHRIQIVF